MTRMLMMRSALGQRTRATALRPPALCDSNSAAMMLRNTLHHHQQQRALSSRQAALLETQVMEQLRTIQDGLGLGDIASLGRIKVRLPMSYNVSA